MLALNGIIAPSVIGSSVSLESPDGQTSLSLNDNAALLSSNDGSVTISASTGIILLPPSKPLTAAATGAAGEIRFDADFIYIAVDVDTWKKVAIATW